MQGVSTIVLQTKNILSENQACQIEIGIIDENGYLTNITHDPNLTIKIVSGHGAIFDDSGAGILYLIPRSLGTIVVRLIYNEIVQTIFNFFSLWCVPQTVYPQPTDIAMAVYKYIYPGCYTLDQTSSVYSKNFATGRIFADIYSNVYQNFLNLYPPFTSDPIWEQEINNNYPWQNSTYYNLVIQEVNNLALYSANVYNTTLLISEYIYARTGQDLFVYVEETFINPANAWILGYSHLGQNTILTDTPDTSNSIIVHIEVASLDPTFENELLIFINKILPADVNATIELNPDFTVFGLIIDVGDVYPEDPRLYVNYALKYNQNTLYNAEGLISPYNPIFITSYTLLPPDGSTYPSNGISFTLTATAVFTYNSVNYPLDVTDASTYISATPSVISLSGNTANIVGPGSSLITATYLAEIAHATYNILDVIWVLGTAVIGTDTVIG